MKRLFSIILLLAAISCQKDESATGTIEQSKYFKPVEFIPEEYQVELRTGQNELVYFDGSGVFADALSLDSIQSVINLRNIDSIQYLTNWQSPTINVQPGNTHCWRYEITFWYNGAIVGQRTAFAKYRGIQYTQIPASLDGWESNVLFFHSVRLSQGTQAYFDHECLKDKRQHQYSIRTRYTDQSSAITLEYIKSNVCNRNIVLYARKFKP